MIFEICITYFLKCLVIFYSLFLLKRGTLRSSTGIHSPPLALFMVMLPILCYAKSLQSCPTLCDPIDSGPPGSPIPGILQARTQEWVAISFSNAWKWKVKVKSLSRVWLLMTPWTTAYQAPPSMGFSRQEYWNGVPLPSPMLPKTHLLHIPRYLALGKWLSGSWRSFLYGSSVYSCHLFCLC